MLNLAGVIHVNTGRLNRITAIAYVVIQAC